MLKIRPGNIVHQQVDALLLLILEDAIDARQRRMIELLEQFAFKQKTLAIPLTRINNLLHGKQVASHTHISYKIDGAKTTFSQKVFHDIPILNDCPCCKGCLYLLHPSPRLL